MFELFRGGALILATLTMGVMAGAFQIYAYSIMPGLGRTDDRTFVGAFQQIDKAIVNPIFMLSFFGALLFTGLAVVLHFRAGGRSVLPWLVAAFVLYLLTFVVTLAINVPLNDAIKAAGDPDRIGDLAKVREDFKEAVWVRWNIVRAVTTTVALGLLAWALVLYGRITD